MPDGATKNLLLVVFSLKSLDHFGETGQTQRRFAFLQIADAFFQQFQAARNKIQILLFALIQAEKAICAEGLHIALQAGGNQTVFQINCGICRVHFFQPRAVIIRQMMAAFAVKVDIAVIDQRHDVVTQRPDSGTLEIHKADASVMHHDVLRLEVAVHINFRLFLHMRRQLVEFRVQRIAFLRGNMAASFQVLLAEIPVSQRR